MNLTGLVFKLAAVAAIAAAAAMAIAALGIALFAVLLDPLGPAGAAASVALAAALIAGLGGWLLFRRSGQGSRRRGRGAGAPEDLADRLIEVARERPMVAAAVAVAAGLVLVRNPALGTVIATALAKRSRRPRPR